MVGIQTDRQANRQTDGRTDRQTVRGAWYSDRQTDVSERRWIFRQTGRGAADDCLPSAHRLVGLVVKASASGAEDLGFESRLHHGDFFGLSQTIDLKIGTPAGVFVEPALGLVGPVSVYCDWVGQKV